MKFYIKDYFSKRLLRIRSHLLKKSLMENFIFCSVNYFSINKVDYYENQFFWKVQTVLKVCKTSLSKFWNRHSLLCFLPSHNVLSFQVEAKNGFWQVFNCKSWGVFRTQWNIYDVAKKLYCRCLNGF